ncbi:MAG: SurA N-terminal domain-containing protein [Betaproteobacteria bacterium]|nr:SurA N-terminal domain-containing protein [Betaproteobacteria bacterium]
MFDFVRKHPKAMQLILALITLPFVFSGVASYVRNETSGSDVASVDGSKITQQELQQALRDQQERMRQQLGQDIPAAMLDSPEVRRAVLDTLISRRVLALDAAKLHLVIDDAQLGAIIQAEPAFQENGKFSRQRYDAFVASQNTSQAEFERRLRQDLTLQQSMSAVREGSFVSPAASDRWVAALQEDREVSEVVYKPEQFTAQVKLPADAVKTYYEANRKLFETPEEVRPEYLVLSQDALAAQVTVSDEEVKNRYQAQLDHYKQGEERRASHILLLAGKDATPAQVKAAQAKAEEILAQLKKSPDDFAKLAKQYSQDPGSAEKGGDLDWFGRGTMVKPFEDAAFSLKENQISGIVRSDFGFHIIKLTGIKAERVKPLQDVRAEIVDELKRQAAAKKYAELAESFSNTVYEQSDSLKPAADKFKLTLQQGPWVTKGANTIATAAAPFNNPKLNAALFSDDAITNKRNTEAIEIAPNTLVAARVVEHKLAALQALDAVKAEIEKRLVREEALKLARQAGEAALAGLLKGGKTDLAWSAERGVTRVSAPGLTPAAARAIFASDVARLPAYAGVALPGDGGYAVYRITQVKPYVAGSADDSRAKTLREQYARIAASEDFAAWLAALRANYPVEINKTALESKERQ